MPKVPPVVAPAAEPPARTDRFLRRFGFAIAARPAAGPALWRDARTGRTVGADEAYRIACARMKGDAK